MKYLFLLLFTGILSLQLQTSPFFYKKRSYIQIPNLEKSSLDHNVKRVYIASITGKKRGISKNLKSALKKYGLLHLLTPSGLHLSSLTTLLIFPALIQIIILFLFLLWIQSYASYFSLERVLIYSLISKGACVLKLKLKPGYLFLSTIIISLVSGNVANSPNSFLYSFLFWGTIFIFKHNPIKVIIFLNLSLHFISNINSETVLIGSIFINPLYSFFFILFFPFLILNIVLQGYLSIEFFIQTYLELWVDSLLTIYSFESSYGTTLSFPVIMGLVFCCSKRFWKLAALVLCINITNLNPERSYVKNEPSIIKTKGCEYQYYRIKCKKKAF